MNMIKYLAASTLLFLLGTGVVLAGETVTVAVKDYKFVPEEITVKAGTTVRWENQEELQYHSILFPGDNKKVDYFFPADFRERTFEKPGTYPYICEPHIESHKMKGVVHVVE